MTIQKAVQGAIDALTIGREIYESVAKAMDSAEISANNGTTGGDKKKWVLAYAKSIILETGKDWLKWEKYIIDFINAAKAIYNSLKALF